MLIEGMDMKQSERGNRKLRQLPKPGGDKRRFLFDADEGRAPSVEYILHGWDFDMARRVYRFFVEDDEGQHVLDVPIHGADMRPGFIDEPESVVFASADEITIPCVAIPSGKVTHESKVLDDDSRDGQRHTFLVCACHAYLVIEWGKRAPMSTEISYFGDNVRHIGDGSREDAAARKAKSYEIDFDTRVIQVGCKPRELTPNQNGIIRYFWQDKQARGQRYFHTSFQEAAAELEIRSRNMYQVFKAGQEKGGCLDIMKLLFKKSTRDNWVLTAELSLRK
jgi:hypothetical protein